MTNRSKKSTSMHSCGFEKVTVDRLLRQPPFHIDGKGLRAYRALEKMAAKVSKEPTSTNAALRLNGREPRIAAIDYGKNGPYNTFIGEVGRCGAAHQNRLSPRSRNRAGGELVICEQTGQTVRTAYSMRTAQS